MMFRRPNIRSLFVSALVIAGLSTFGAYHLLQASRPKADTRQLVVASEDIVEGTVLRSDQLTVAPWPASSLIEGGFSVADSVVGRVLRTTVLRGDPITAGRLAPDGSGPGLEVKIDPGHRAMAVKINDVAGISGLIQPNSRVDVLVTLRENSSSDRQVAKLFLENIRVLSVGTRVQRTSDGKPIEATSAALEVTPTQAERLAVAMNQGSIQLVLRGYGDPASVPTSGASSEDILRQLRDAPAVQVNRPSPPAKRQQRETPARVPPSPEPAREEHTTPHTDTAVVKVYHGDKVTQQIFEKKDTTRGRPPRT
jgi:pilus assembly protein CpaB